jgi:hypothetical protein
MVRVNVITARRLAASLLVVIAGGAALAAPPPREPLRPGILLRQLPSGEVLLLDPEVMRLSRWAGGVPEEVATFRPAPCPPHAFAWDAAGQRLALLCAFRLGETVVRVGLQGRAVRNQELYLVHAGRQPRSLRPPPLEFTWALEFMGDELHAAGVPCPTGPCTQFLDTGSWREKHLLEPQPAWWRLPLATGRWVPVRAVEPLPSWRTFVPPGGRRDKLIQQAVTGAIFEVSPALFAPTASGRRWFFTAAGPHVELLSREGVAVARHLSPLPPPAKTTLRGPRGGPPSEIPVRRLVGATVVGEELYLLVEAEQGQELLRLTPEGEVARQSLPGAQGCAQEGLLTCGLPWPCQVAVREQAVVVNPPWQEHPLAPEMRPPSLQAGEEVGGDVALGGGGDDEDHQLAGVLRASRHGDGGVGRRP